MSDANLLRRRLAASRRLPGRVPVGSGFVSISAAFVSSIVCRAITTASVLTVSNSRRKIGEGGGLSQK